MRDTRGEIERKRKRKKKNWKMNFGKGSNRDLCLLKANQNWLLMREILALFTKQITPYMGA